MGKKTYWQKYGEILRNRDGMTCHYCGDWIASFHELREMPEFTSLPIMAQEAFSMRHLATVDHVTPRVFGGTDDLSNLVLACAGCNTGKMDKLDPSRHYRAKSFFDYLLGGEK
jgi:hypothetical protein